MGRYRGDWYYVGNTWVEEVIRAQQRQRDDRERKERIERLRLRMRKVSAPASAPAKADPAIEALIDIAHDCGTLEAAQRRAKDALRQAKGGR